MTKPRKGKVPASAWVILRNGDPVSVHRTQAAARKQCLDMNFDFRVWKRLPPVDLAIHRYVPAKEK